MASNALGEDPIIIRDDDDVHSILENIDPAPSVNILSLEGDMYEARLGDIVQVLSSSGGFQGTLAYAQAFTDIGQINVCMPINQQIQAQSGIILRRRIACSKEGQCVN